MHLSRACRIAKINKEDSISIQQGRRDRRGRTSSCNMVNKKALACGIALALTAGGFAGQPVMASPAQDEVEVVSENDSASTVVASPLKGQQKKAESAATAKKDPKPAYQMKDTSDKEVDESKVYPKGYHSPSPLRAQREAAEAAAKAFIDGGKVENTDKTPQVNPLDGKDSVLMKEEITAIENAKPYEHTFIYDKAPVFNNGVKSYRTMHVTIRAIDAMNKDGQLGKSVTITRDYIRYWKESDVSRMPVLGTKTEQFFFPGEQGKEFDPGKIGIKEETEVA